MRGSGLKGVALLADSEKELRHFMLGRLSHRAGLGQDPTKNFFLGTTGEPGLTQSLQARGVKTIMTLGEAALRHTLGESDIIRWRGRTVAHPHLPGVWVVPGFAPSQLLNYRGNKDDEDDDVMRHPPRFHGVWMRDIHHAIEVAQRGFSRSPVEYLLDPDPAEFTSWADSYFAALAADPLGVWLSWDIETYYKGNKDESELEVDQLEGAILRISFSFASGAAVSVPYNSSYEPTIRRLLASRGVMVVWNGTVFDIPVVRAAGFTVNGIIYEGMDAYHLLQSDLPKGLEWVSSEATDVLPWKHLAQAQPAHYSCADADVALRNMIWLKGQLTASGQWDLFLSHVVRLMPIMARAGEHGNLMDTELRAAVRGEMLAMKKALSDEAQNYVPRELFPRKLYKILPDALGDAIERDFAPSRTSVEALALPEWDIVWEPEPAKFCSHCEQPASNKTEHFKGGKKNNPCKAAGGEIVVVPAFVPRFYQLEPFNLGSSDQLKSYMRHFGHPIGENKKDSSKETADSGHLKKLVKSVGKKFPIYALAIQYSKASKTIGTYTPEPDANGILHTVYVNTPSTWRFGSKKTLHGTQIQNWGKREENPYAKRARKQIIARLGHKLVQIDSSAVEAVMQGYFMNDPEYMKTASQSIHAWLACKKLGLAFNPDNVEKVKRDHAGLYNQMKTTNYLTNFGGGPKLMADTFPEIYPSKAVAQAVQDELYALLPTLKTYHHAQRYEAHTKTYLTTPWGYRHYFYDVFQISWDQTIKLSKDGKRCVAFRPQNSNASFQKDNLLIIGESKFGIYLPTNASVHDSCCLDVPMPMVDEAVEFLLATFTRPIPQMRGLRIGAEVEVGDNWGEMERVAKVVVDDYTMATTFAGLAEAA